MFVMGRPSGAQACAAGSRAICQPATLPSRSVQTIAHSLWYERPVSGTRAARAEDDAIGLGEERGRREVLDVQRLCQAG